MMLFIAGALGGSIATLFTMSLMYMAKSGDHRMEEL